MKGDNARRDMAGRMRLKGPSEAFKRAMARYRPNSIRVLFIAEAPPPYRAKRFFYFDNLGTGDTLFLEMMKVIYGTKIGFTESEGFSQPRSVKDIRRRKAELLDHFMADGFFLIDASEQPMPNGATTSTKLILIRNSLSDLKTRVRNLIGDKRVPIVLIGSVTYSACLECLNKEGFYIVNKEMINHPARGGQLLFRKKLEITLGRIFRNE